jgi:hypothetical protein
LIAWFGPRGLSSLLIVLLPVFAGMPGSARLFSLCSLVVLLSVLIHGGSLMLLGRRAAAPVTEPVQPPLPSEPKPPVVDHGEPAAPEAVIPDQITLDELRALEERGEPVVIVDARSRRSLDSSDITARGSVRLDPERTVKEAERLQFPREAWLVAYCA